MTKNTLLNKIKELNIVEQEDDFVLIEKLKLLLKSGTIQTLRGFRGYDTSMLNVFDSTNQVFYRTILKVTCSDGTFAVDLKSKLKVFVYSSYIREMELINTGIEITIIKGVIKSFAAIGLSDEKKYMLAKAHRYLDSATEELLLNSSNAVELLLNVAKYYSDKNKK